LWVVSAGKLWPRRDRRRRFRGLAVLLACAAASVCDKAPTTPTVPPRPQLLCPADVSIGGVVGATQSVIYTPPVQIGGSTPITVVCSPLSGSLFPVGETMVTCQATDTFSQTGSCSFNVTLRSLQLNALKFLAFGDSVTEGDIAQLVAGRIVLFVDAPNSYPARLDLMLMDGFPGQGTSVVNAGRGGEFAAEGIDRLSDVLAVNQPEVLLLLEGYNDLLSLDDDGVEPAVEGLEDMVRFAKSSKVAHVFISTLTPGRLGQRQIAPGLIQEANALIRSLAVAEGVILVDAFNAFVGREATLVGDDGLHLTPAGYEVLAQVFFDAIRATATTTTTGPLARLR
jgi:lysophospholipase L1-like esterase